MSPVGIEILPDWVARHARVRPGSVALAVAETGETVTWGALEDRVGRLAAVLRDDLGVGVGDRVALVAENDWRVLELQFACMRIGAILVPLNWRLAVAELVAMLADAEPAVLVHDAEWSGLADRLLTAVPVPSRLGWGTAAAGYDGAIASAARPVPGRDLDPDAATHVLYTSGTTGLPKGVLCTNRTLVTQALNLAHTSRMAERGRHHLNIVPLFHAGGLNVFTNPALYWGGRVTTTRRFDARATLDLLTDPDLRITHLCGVLQMYEWLVRLDGFAAARFPALETVLFGGWGPSTLEIYRALRAHGIQVQLSYGASEIGPNVSILAAPDDEAAAARLVRDRGAAPAHPPHRRRTARRWRWARSASCGSAAAA